MLLKFYMVFVLFNNGWAPLTDSENAIECNLSAQMQRMRGKEAVCMAMEIKLPEINRQIAGE